MGGQANTTNLKLIDLERVVTGLAELIPPQEGEDKDIKLSESKYIRLEKIPRVIRNQLWLLLPGCKITGNYMRGAIFRNIIDSEDVRVLGNCHFEKGYIYYGELVDKTGDGGYYERIILELGGMYPAEKKIDLLVAKYGDNILIYRKDQTKSWAGYRECDLASHLPTQRLLSEYILEQINGKKADPTTSNSSNSIILQRL